MRVLLTTLGTAGDVTPFLSLARALKGRGHEAVLSSFPLFRSLAEAGGVDFIPNRTEFTLEQHDTMSRRIKKSRNPRHQLRLMFEGLILYDARNRFEDLRALAAGFDLMVCHNMDICAHEAAIALGMPWVSTALHPFMIRDVRYFPGSPVRRDWLAPVNRMAWSAVSLLERSCIRKPIREFSRSVGNPERQTGFFVPSPYLNLYAFPGRLTGFSDKSALNRCLTGPWMPDGDPGYRPPRELEDFLAAGPKPVAVTFGSVGGEDREETSRLLVEALRLSGQRGVIQKGWGDLPEAGGGEAVCFAGYIPHDWLFARSSFVIHHGGAGTTMAAVRAGLPSLGWPTGGISSSGGTV